MFLLKIFLISPVRLANDSNTVIVRQLVEQLESEGHEVHWPLRDTKQDASSIDICKQNVAAICWSDIVYVYFLPDSGGSKFDLGAAFALKKPIRVVNDIERNDHKGFQNLILEWEAGGKLDGEIS